MKAEVGDLLEKSRHALVVSKDLLKDGHAPEAAGRAYYCMFYAAQALLKSQGIKAFKHSGVEAQFGFHFSNAGKIDVRFHKMLRRARILREDADYGVGPALSDSTAKQLILEGEEFIIEIKKLIGIS